MREAEINNGRGSQPVSPNRPENGDAPTASSDEDGAVGGGADVGPEEAGYTLLPDCDHPDDEDESEEEKEPKGETEESTVQLDVDAELQRVLNSDGGTFGTFPAKVRLFCLFSTIL